MNYEKAGAAAPKTSLFDLMVAAGQKTSSRKSKLWSITSVISEGTPAEELDIRVSMKYANSAYVLMQQGERSFTVGFHPDGGIPIEGLVYDETSGKISARSLVDYSIDVVAVSATRDDEELNIAKGDTAVRMFAQLR